MRDSFDDNVILFRLQTDDFVKTLLFYSKLSHEIRNAESVRRSHCKDLYQNEKNAYD